MKKFLLPALIIGMLFGAQSATAEDEFYVVAGGRGVGTRIISLPYTITNRGFYYLAKDLSTESNGIIINCNDVVIDFMGFTINGSSPTNNYSGISVGTSNVWNVVIRNGSIRNFSKAINAPRAGNRIDLSKISNITVRECSDGIIVNQGDINNCIVYNIAKQGFGIQLWGGSIRKCQVYNANVGIDVIKGANIQENVAFDNAIGIQSKYSDVEQQGLSILNNNYSSDNGVNYNVNPSSAKGVNLNY